MLVFVIVTVKEPSVEYNAKKDGEGINNVIVRAYIHTHIYAFLFSDGCSVNISIIS
jgi:hypothetical protein